jgi:hypothetical protein
MSRHRQSANTDKQKRIIFAIVVALALVGAVVYTGVSVANRQSASESGGAEEIAESADIVFRNASGIEDEGRIGFTSLGDDSRGLAAMKCDRVYFRSEVGVCLTTNENKTGFTTKVFDRNFDVRHEIPAAGIPSRIRISPQATWASTTVFVFGHSYADGNFSTETSLINLESGKRLGQLEDFDSYIDGTRVDAPDVNYWGVTFVDEDRYYATMSTGGTDYLVEGSISERRMDVIHEGVECPSLSPDGTRVAFKSATSSSEWQLKVLDLATMEETTLAEPRSVDDQVEWLDNDTILYGVIEADLYSVPADGTGEPELFLEDAGSPAILHSAKSS